MSTPAPPRYLKIMVITKAVHCMQNPNAIQVIQITDKTASVNNSTNKVRFSPVHSGNPLYVQLNVVSNTHIEEFCTFNL